MYLTGTKFDLQNRLHQFPTGVYDLNVFWTEYQSYISGVDYSVQNKLIREFSHKYYSFTLNTYQSGFLSGIATISGVSGVITFDSSSITFDSSHYTFDQI